MGETMVSADMTAPATTSSYMRSVAAGAKSLRECLDAGQPATEAISALVERARGGARSSVPNPTNSAWRWPG